MAQIPDNRLTLVFPQLPGFEIVPSKSALLIIDMQYLDAHPDFGMGIQLKEAGLHHTFDYYWEAIAKALPNQQKLIGVAREANMNVIYTRIATLTPDARDVGR